jgi:hypothetical protein
MRNSTLTASRLKSDSKSKNESREPILRVLPHKTIPTFRDFQHVLRKELILAEIAHPSYIMVENKEIINKNNN